MAVLYRVTDGFFRVAKFTVTTVMEIPVTAIMENAADTTTEQIISTKKSIK